MSFRRITMTGLCLVLFVSGALPACSSSDDGDDEGSGASNGTGASHNTAIGGVTIDVDGNGSSGNSAGGTAGLGDTCAEQRYEQNLVAKPLDVFFVFDRTGSMGEDCAYQPGEAADVDSKACYATYALSDYLTGTTPIVDTRLAFQFMSLSQNDCDGTAYATPAVPLQELPVAPDSSLIQLISEEEFQGGAGTHIEGALRGIAQFTSENVVPEREMIGVLMTDGDPNGCEEDIAALSEIIAEHRAATGLRTFVIGMDGATDANLERLAEVGGAEPHDEWCGSAGAPCHYFNVGNGSGSAIASALSAIISQAIPMPCEIELEDLEDTSDGATTDYSRVNVTYTDPNGTMTIGQVPEVDACPDDQPAWYYDDPASPTQIRLCATACTMVTSSPTGSRVDLAVGCRDTVVVEIPR
jgi:hypothetical protein